jgi:hypothetical protein
LRSDLDHDRILETVAVNVSMPYQLSGATWAACVQAVKTDEVGQFINKYRK